MSPRKKTAPPPKDATARPSKSVRSSLIAKDKKKTRSAQERSALDDRFHRTDLRFSGCGPRAERESSVAGGGPQSAATAMLGGERSRATLQTAFLLQNRRV